jgi:hypothetical protein
VRFPEWAYLILLNHSILGLFGNEQMTNARALSHGGGYYSPACSILTLAFLFVASRYGRVSWYSVIPAIASTIGSIASGIGLPPVAPR